MNINPIASTFTMEGLVTFAESLGEALGRGVLRGMNAGLTGSVPSSVNVLHGRRRPGRPPKMQSAGPVPEDRRCKVDDCTNPARSKGLCSKHYQAERRRMQAKA